MSSYIDAFTPALSGAAWDQYAYDPAKSAEYITALCAEEGVDCTATPPKAVFTTTSNNATRVLLSELFIQMFADAGIGYEAQLEDSSLFFGETIALRQLRPRPSGRGSAPRAWPALVSIHDLCDPEAAAAGGPELLPLGHRRK